LLDFPTSDFDGFQGKRTRRLTALAERRTRKAETDDATMLAANNNSDSRSCDFPVSF